ncbi:hypothetical protein ACHAWO_001140 [Cyclotella atomus]|uniref:Uncharacterized protein n=1 Tax=Cyclotella atomus TaxID=382360 RepID=A0ABD3MSE2_9STRA
MSGDRLNTAEHDSKGRCIRHPDIRLRKKKLLGGWKILIGHCPECCLDEMRRVRDEIEGGEKKKKKDKKKSSSSSSGKKDKKKLERKDSDERSHGVSLTSEGYDPNGPARGHPRGRHREDGESDATGSTAQMSGGGSVVSEQYYREQGGPMSPGHGHHQHHHSADSYRGYHPPHHQQPYQQAPMMGHQVERTMVLSMPFVDPQTGMKGTYTGQVNSINHKPDGKGTVYYNNGTIAEGSWNNGILTSDGSEEEESQASYERSRSYSRSRTRESSRSASRNRGQAQLPEHESGFGNLHLLNALPGSKQPRPRGGSASVQSFNSRNSHGHNISGSASVQAGYSGEGGIYGGGGGGMARYAPPPPRSMRRSVGSPPPTMNMRGEYEP